MKPLPLHFDAGEGLCDACGEQAARRTGASLPYMRTPHDKLFRLAFRIPERARGLLRVALPSAIVRKLDLSPVRVIPGSFQVGAGAWDAPAALAL
jgi:hypothetical protein